MLSNRVAPEGRSAQERSWLNATWSNRRASVCAFCSSRNQASVSPPVWTVTRVGTVLMNRPTIDSTPGSSAGRPDTVVPNTTSRSPL